MTLITNNVDVITDKKRNENSNNYFYNANEVGNIINPDEVDGCNNGILNEGGEVLSNYQHNQQQFLTNLPAQFYKSLLAKAVLADDNVINDYFYTF